LGRNKPRRQDRRWVSAWSPQQISERLKLDFPDDRSMRISHEAIYQALYVQSRGALKRELDMQSGRRVAGTLGACAALRVGRSRPRAPERRRSHHHGARRWGWRRLESDRPCR
jgi:IS30 family transposase